MFAKIMYKKEKGVLSLIMLQLILIITLLLLCFRLQKDAGASKLWGYKGW